MLKRINFDIKIFTKLIVLAIIAWIYLGRSFNSYEMPYVKGDGFEYILMTEAISNHLTPNVTAEDCEKFKAKYSKAHTWDAFWKRDYVDNLIYYFKNAKGTYKETFNGFYINKNKNWYSYHFCFFSLLNVPAYKIGAHFGPIRTFYFTNAILVIFTCFVLLFFTPFSTFNQILASLCFCFSACYWYLSWQHTEIYTACLVAMGLVAFFNKRNYLSIFVIALACLQNQPLILLLGFISLVTLIQKGFNKKNILWLSGLCFIAIIPPIFYYINFETTNLIKDSGFLDTKYITVNRINGFYWDINQGMVLTIPLILLCYLPLIIIEIKNVLRKKQEFDYSIFLPLVILATSMSIATMGNWNHGMAIINRYATWISIIVMIHVFYLMNKRSLLTATIFFNYFFVTQLTTTLYHEKFNDYDWSYVSYTPLSKWALRNTPDLYSPDPTIFAKRTQPNSSLIERDSPFIYFYKKVPKKIMVHRNRVDSLINFGISKEDLEKIKEDIHYNFDWGYVDMDLFKSKLTNEQIYNIIREKKILAAYDKITPSAFWMNQIKEKAAAANMTFEKVLRLDAEYVVYLDEQEELKDK